MGPPQQVTSGYRTGFKKALKMAGCVFTQFACTAFHTYKNPPYCQWAEV